MKTAPTLQTLESVRRARDCGAAEVNHLASQERSENLSHAEDSGRACGRRRADCADASATLITTVAHSCPASFPFWAPSATLIPRPISPAPPILPMAAESLLPRPSAL